MGDRLTTADMGQNDKGPKVGAAVRCPFPWGNCMGHV